MALRSYTGELLQPILDSEPRGEIEVFNAVEAAAKRNGDLDLRQVGKDAALPWQADGRRWHTRDRLAHNGKPCRWEGAALDLVIDALAGCKDLAAPNWNHRSIVEVMAAEKTGGWFLHAQTGDEWLLTLKFRVKKNSFDQTALSRRLNLKPIDDLDELAVYGRGERARVKNLKGPWQEITVTVHWRREVDTPEFRQFLQQAVAAYLAQSRTAGISPEDLTPWKVLGRKWHVSRKGFSNQKRIAWDPDVLETLFQALEEALPGAAWDWSNKQVVSVAPRDASPPWALVHTKRRSGVDLTLLGEAGRFALGRFAEMGAEREITPHRDGREAIKLRFDEVAQVRAPDFRNFLAEHAP